MCADQSRAIWVSCACGVRVWIPSDDLSWLVSARNWASSLPESAWAGGARAVANPANVASVANHAATTRTHLTLTCGGSDVDGVALTGLVRNGPPALVPPHSHCQAHLY